jgi:hypothetical protein
LLKPVQRNQKLNTQNNPFGAGAAAMPHNRSRGQIGGTARVLFDFLHHST